jgi:hypothetical protein
VTITEVALKCNNNYYIVRISSARCWTLVKSRGRSRRFLLIRIIARVASASITGPLTRRIKQRREERGIQRHELWRGRRRYGR